MARSYDHSVHLTRSLVLSAFFEFTTTACKFRKEFQERSRKSWQV
jgi:hypothetical protein